jgi:hypothetical protein
MLKKSLLALGFVIAAACALGTASDDSAKMITHAVSSLVATPALAQETPPSPAPEQPRDSKVDVTVTEEHQVWFADPVWIGVGILVLLLIVVLVALAGRGGGAGTTVIRS